MASKPTGRPRGRPKGTITQRREQIRDAIETAAPELIEKLIAAGKAGDIGAAVALLDRVAPKLRPTAMAVCVDLTGTHAEVGERLLEAVGRGDVPVDVGLELAVLVSRANATDSPPPPPPPIDTASLDAIYRQGLARAAERRERMVDNRDIIMRELGINEGDTND